LGQNQLLRARYNQYELPLQLADLHREVPFASSPPLPETVKMADLRQCMTDTFLFIASQRPFIKSGILPREIEPKACKIVPSALKIPSAG
jgi:hypothetical protein